MPKLNLMRITLTACFAVMVAFPQVYAQFGNTYYHMFGIPQANLLNPAFQPECSGYLGLPLIGRGIQFPHLC